MLATDRLGSEDRQSVEGALERAQAVLAAFGRP
jgi:hypothetical protein